MNVNFLKIGILVVLLTIITIELWPRLKKKFSKQKSEPNNTNMRKQDYYYQGGQTEQTQRGSNQVDESRPAAIAIIYRSEMDYISRCIHDYPNIETGGQLFGFVTEYGAPVVCYALGPGSRANHQSTFFNQDVDYLQNVYNELNRKFGLRYIGEWHSHHQLGLAKPSGHDATTIVHGIQKNNFRHFLLCIGNCDSYQHSTLNAFTFYINDPYNYYHAPWKIIEMVSPYRHVVDRELDYLLCHPRTQRASYGSNYIITDTGTTSMITPNYTDEYWLNDKANNINLKRIIDFLNSCENASVVRPMLDDQKHVHLMVQRGARQERIVFGNQFPNEAPKIGVTGGVYVNNTAVWQYDGNIYDSFVRYYTDYFKKEPIELSPDSNNGEADKPDKPMEAQDNGDETQNQELPQDVVEESGTETPSPTENEGTENETETLPENSEIKL